jgi:hypothetical protein
MKSEWGDSCSSGTEKMANWRASGTETGLFCLWIDGRLAEDASYPFPWVEVGGISDSFKRGAFDFIPWNK